MQEIVDGKAVTYQDGACDPKSTTKPATGASTTTAAGGGVGQQSAVNEAVSPTFWIPPVTTTETTREVPDITKYLTQTETTTTTKTAAASRLVLWSAPLILQALCTYLVL